MAFVTDIRYPNVYPAFSENIFGKIEKNFQLHNSFHQSPGYWSKI